MNAADWRALIEAYLDGRLSAEAFMRRFVEAWRQSEGGAPRAIADLNVVVEAFEAEVMAAMEDGQVNDDEMRRAAQNALAERSGELAGTAAKIADLRRQIDEKVAEITELKGDADADEDDDDDEPVETVAEELPAEDSAP